MIVIRTVRGAHGTEAGLAVEECAAVSLEAVALCGGAAFGHEGTLVAPRLHLWPEEIICGVRAQGFESLPTTRNMSRKVIA